MMKLLTVGFFGHDKWAEILLEKITNDRSILIKFICLRYNSDSLKIKKIAKKNKIKIISYKNINSIKSIKFLKSIDLDLYLSMSYDQIFNKKIISIPKKGIINCHAGKLPDYKGRNIINWAIINGEKKYGITTHFIDEKIDNGKILMQNTFKILDSDNYQTVLTKSYNRCAKIMYSTIKRVQKNNIKPKSQSLFKGKSRYFKKRTSDDEFINWSQNNIDIHNFIRGVSSPAPGAKSMYGKKIIRFYKSSIRLKLKKKKGDEIGKIIKKTNNSLFVVCKKGIIKIFNWKTKANISEGDIIK